jgi:hypothetical protein
LIEGGSLQQSSFANSGQGEMMHFPFVCIQGRDDFELLRVHQVYVNHHNKYEVTRMIKRMFTLSVVAGVVLSASVASAGTVAVSFSDLSAEAAYNQNITEDAWGRSVFGVRGIYNDRHDTKLVSLGLEVLGSMGGTGLELGAGARGYYAESDNHDVGAGGLGGLIRFVTPGLEQLSFSGSVYYCPKVFTGLDGERMTDAEAKVAFEIVPRATVFVSYTEIRAKIEDRGTRNLDDTFRVGLALTF